MKRLKDLREMAEELNPIHIDIWPYWTADNKGCFLGHAAHHELFTLQGLSWEPEEGQVSFICQEKWGKELYEGFEAAMCFFGLDQREALWLFGDSYYNRDMLPEMTGEELKELFLVRVSTLIEQRTLGMR